MTNVDLLADLPGFRDYYPEDWAKIHFILTNMRNVATRYGYDEYEGPSVEAVELIEAKSGSDLMSEIFTLKDKNDRRLLLRPEQTPTLARMLAKEQQRYKRPIRWFSIPRLFRDETAQKGRTREFWQLNVDILGVEDLAADAEVMAVGIDIIRECGIKDHQFNVYVNNRGFLSSVINEYTDINVQEIIPIIDKKASFIQNYVFASLKENGIDEKDATQLSLYFRRFINSSGQFKQKLEEELPKELQSYLEKVDEIERKVMISELQSVGVQNEAANQIYKITAISGNPDEFLAEMKKLELSDTIKTHIAKFEKLATHLTSFGVSEPIIFDASLARGLDYYTGFVFEVFDATGELVRALLGGGRYDNLVEIMGGNPLTGTGFGMGELPILELIKIHGEFPRTLAKSIDFYIAPINNKTISEVIDLATQLRSKFEIVCNPFKWKLGRHFEYADNINAKYTILLGPKDLEKKQISIRNMKNQEQHEFALDSNLIANLMNLLN